MSFPGREQQADSRTVDDVVAVEVGGTAEDTVAGFIDASWEHDDRARFPSR